MTGMATPCSERCANWLLYGVQPKKARPGLKPGNCKNKVHKRETLGSGGRRVLLSRQWSGKTLADHRTDRREWVKALLGVTTDADTASAGGEQRHAWELAKPTDPDVPPLGHRVLRAISERTPMAGNTRRHQTQPGTTPCFRQLHEPGGSSMKTRPRPSNRCGRLRTCRPSSGYRWAPSISGATAGSGRGRLGSVGICDMTRPTCAPA